MPRQACCSGTSSDTARRTSPTTAARRQSSGRQRGPRRRPTRSLLGKRSRRRRPEGCSATAAASRRAARPATRYVGATAAKTGVLGRSILMKMGSAARLLVQGHRIDDCHVRFQLRALSLRRISARSSEKALLGYCSSIFLGRTRAGVRAMAAGNRRLLGAQSANPPKRPHRRLPA